MRGKIELCNKKCLTNVINEMGENDDDDDIAHSFPSFFLFCDSQVHLPSQVNNPL